MKLKGLSRYDVRLADDGVRVYSLCRNRYLLSRNLHGQEQWSLTTDGGAHKQVTEGQLRFMISHPEVSAEAIVCRSCRIKFRKDGTIDNLYGGERGRSYAHFTSAQDALNTVLFLMAAHDGNLLPLLRFVEESRHNAIKTAARLLHISYGAVSRNFESAAERFIKETQTFNVERLYPIFTWLCKCLRYTTIEQRSLEISKDMDRFGENPSEEFFNQ